MKMKGDALLVNSYQHFSQLFDEFSNLSMKNHIPNHYKANRSLIPKLQDGTATHRARFRYTQRTHMREIRLAQPARFVDLREKPPRKDLSLPSSALSSSEKYEAGHPENNQDSPSADIQTRSLLQCPNCSSKRI